MGTAGDLLLGIVAAVVLLTAVFNFCLIAPLLKARFSSKATLNGR